MVRAVCRRVEVRHSARLATVTVLATREAELSVVEVQRAVRARPAVRTHALAGDAEPAGRGRAVCVGRARRTAVRRSADVDCARRTVQQRHARAPLVTTRCRVFVQMGFARAVGAVHDAGRGTVAARGRERACAKCECGARSRRTMQTERFRTRTRRCAHRSSRTRWCSSLASACSWQPGCRTSR